MRATALSSLAALKLDGHQAMMAGHGDKEHLHVHIVVNTINPDTGLTAPLKYTKEQLSRWAEAYEREHGIHCEDRIKNNEARDNIRTAKEATRISWLAMMQTRASPSVLTCRSSTPRRIGSNGSIAKTSPTA